MVDTTALKVELVKQGYTQHSFCQKLGMPESTFCRRMKSGVFKTDEVQKIACLLKLEKPETIFFAREIT